jgi:segregation and condensation protein A
MGPGPGTASANHTDVISIDPMPYEVTTPVFEGPFDLLLHLILREQVELYDISLTRIVDAYLRELDAMEHFSLDVATEFLRA